MSWNPFRTNAVPEPEPVPDPKPIPINFSWSVECPRVGGSDKLLVTGDGSSLVDLKFTYPSGTLSDRYVRVKLSDLKAFVAAIELAVGSK